MSVADFLKRHEDNPNSELVEGKNVHPMNVIDIPLDYIEAEGEVSKRKCGSVINLPTQVLANSLGHKYQTKLKAGSPLDLISAHHKYLLLSEAGAYTEPHEDMTGSNVFYALLKGEKNFHVYYRNPNLTKMLRTKTPEKFDKILEGPEWRFAKVNVKAGQCVIMPGNLVHRVYTISDSVAIGCNFISEPQMKNALLARSWENTMVASESSKPIEMREIKESNLFINFPAIAAIFIYEKLQYNRLNIEQNESAAKKELRDFICRFYKIMKQTTTGKIEDKKVQDRRIAKFLNNLKKECLTFDWELIEKFYDTDSFC